MKIAVVIVTYNRIKLLKDALAAFDHQSRLPELVVVVDNASTDGTGAYLKEWRKTREDINKIVVRNEKNLGGAGGFYVGTKIAMDTDADWIWVSDDDAIPDLDVIEKAERHISELKDINEVSAICSAVYTGGKIAETNRSYRTKTFGKVEFSPVPTIEYEKDKFYCDIFSYVGVLMNRQKLDVCGLIRKEFFIWRDDVEHSWRLSLNGDIICFPDMKVEHKNNYKDYCGITWKTYYGYRNDIIMLNEMCSLRYGIIKAIKALVRGIISGRKRHLELYIDAIIAGLKREGGSNPKYMPNSWRY